MSKCQIETDQIERVLFIGVFPGGISYVDRTRERDGDYMRLAFLPYSTLTLELHDGFREVADCVKRAIWSHAEAMAAKRGQQYAISASGQTVALGNQSTYAGVGQ